jgi:hypothetical protein
MMLFFDKAAFYLSRGYELENPGEPVDTVN